MMGAMRNGLPANAKPKSCMREGPPSPSAPIMTRTHTRFHEPFRTKWRDAF
jgi:hypothetical protein